MKRHSVGEIMTRDVVSVRGTTGYKEIVATLSEHTLTAVPVVDDIGQVLGVVSEADLLHKVELSCVQTPRRLLERKRTRVARDKAEADVACDLMTAPAIVIGAHDSVAQAARLMDLERVKRLPVVGADGRLIGIVSRGDILRLFLRDDEEIRREVIEEVLLRTLWIDSRKLNVAVDHGVVTLAGTLDRRSAIAIVLRLVHAVAGVVDVVNHLSYHYDDVRRRTDRDEHRSWPEVERPDRPDRQTLTSRS
jgi:CBS domain-containing protein